MGRKSKYEKFDPVDWLTSEVACEVYITALREDGASDDLMEEAYQDVERARIVHNIPAPTLAQAV